jgi:hypothetical protein
MEHINRRSFVKGVLPLCAAGCLALKGQPLGAQTTPKEEPKASPGHKFDRAMKHPLSYRQFMTVEYAYHFIPFLRILEKEIGPDKVITALKKFTLWESETGAKETVKARGKNDLSIFKDDYNPRTPQLTTEVLEDSEKVWDIKITECLWAKVWIDAGAADLGVAAVCAGDSPYAGFINPKIKMDLEGTLMEGKPYCILRYHYIEI